MRRAPLSLVLLLAAAACAEPPLVNVATPRSGTVATADACYGADVDGSHALDGHPADRADGWLSADSCKLPCALTLHFASDCDVRRVVLTQAKWNGSMYHTRDYAVEVSSDGTTWSRVATGTLPDESLARASHEVIAHARWLRVVVLTSYIQPQICGLAKLEVWAAGVVGFGEPVVELNGKVTQGTDDAAGLVVYAGADGPQVGIVPGSHELTAVVQNGETVRVSIPITAEGDWRVEGGVVGGPSEVSVAVDGRPAYTALLPGHGETPVEAQGEGPGRVFLHVRGLGPETTVRWFGLAVHAGRTNLDVPLGPGSPKPVTFPVAVTPRLREPLQAALIAADWRLADGIGTALEPHDLRSATLRTLETGQRLLDDLLAGGHRARLGELPAQWNALRRQAEQMGKDGDAHLPNWYPLWLGAHQLRRAIALANPLVDTGPLVFAKHVPGAFSHQLTQYYGRYARPGGGIFVLEHPGASMDCRELAAGALPAGNFMHPTASYDGRRVRFAFCQTPAPPANSIQGEHGRYYHLYQVNADGTGLRQLTDGPYDDFAPRELPDGNVVFCSTRRGGWHRCGSPGCETYTITTCNPDGSDPRSMSLHETNEWDPAVLNDGRLVYTRWDYVDRHPVFFEQLWSMHPDGTRQGIYFGNNTFNPVGIWESQAVPGSAKIMCIAGPHHAMTAGSVILVDVRRGVDGLGPLTRLTPETPFPESETPVRASWYAPQGVPRVETEASKRWPGSCYKSPWPLSEKYFLASFSYQPLVGEPQANPPAQFGLYLVDVFGNRELLYRDPRISSVWAMPLRPRQRPPVLASQLDAGEGGTYVLENVYEAAPGLPAGAVKALRIVQVLPKSTPGIDNPAIGIPRGAPGKQVLGTVPVEPDGSAHFRVPARIELAFQALDERGVALQTMRSGAMLQPGETVTCVGCHDRRTVAPRRREPVTALGREPSAIAPGPDGSKPLSYPLLVQPVLDRACVSCHGGKDPAGGVALTGEPEGHYTVSYNRLARRVPFSDQDNGESLSRPGRFGSQGSGLTKVIFGEHHGVKLSRDELDRLVTWMDVNVLFYGTFDPADQARQLRAERIGGPKLE